MTIEANLLAYNEHGFIGYAVKHYKSFCQSVFVHDLGSRDNTQGIARLQGAKVIQWDCRGEFDDLLNRKIKSDCHGSPGSDWWIAVDCDELLIFPDGVEKSFASYEAQKLPFIKPSGYEMVSDVYPTTQGQVYDEIKVGALDNHWYGKVSCFSTRRVAQTDFAVGAHSVRVTLNPTSFVEADRTWPLTDPPCKLCHFHQIDSVENIARKYAATKARMSANNIKYNWGWHGDPLQHAKDKRAYILQRLEKVIK